MRGPEVCGQDRRFTSQQLGRPWQPVTRVKSSTLVLVLPDSREQRRLRIWGKDTSQGIGGGQVWGTPEEAKGSHKRRTRSWTWALPEIWGISMALSASQTVPRVWGGILAKLFCLWRAKAVGKWARALLCVLSFSNHPSWRASSFASVTLATRDNDRDMFLRSAFPPYRIPDTYSQNVKWNFSLKSCLVQYKYPTFKTKDLRILLGSSGTQKQILGLKQTLSHKYLVNIC